jgi:uncharacterized OsmC-like protein
MTSDRVTPKVVPPSRETLRCRTVAGGAFQQSNYLRGLPPLLVAERFGPANDAPVATPSETLLAALGSCLSARIHANAASGSIAVHSLELIIEADVVTSPMWAPLDQEPRQVGFEAIRVEVRMEAASSSEALRALIAHAVLWSPVANTLHGPVHLDVSLVGATEANRCTVSS